MEIIFATLMVIVGVAIGWLVLAFVLLAVANRTVRNDLGVPTPRSESLMRWNFWTLGVASMGAVLRVAFIKADSSDGLSTSLRAWTRSYLVATTAAILLLMVTSVVMPLANLLSYAVVLGVLIHYFKRLSKETAQLHESLSKAAKKGLTLTLTSVGTYVLAAVFAGVCYGITGSQRSAFLVGGLLAAVGLGLGMAGWVQMIRTWLHLGIAAKSAGDDANSRTGGRDTLVALGAYVGLLLLAGLAGMLGPHAYHVAG
jgi:hypothetical protein